LLKFIVLRNDSPEETKQERYMSELLRLHIGKYCEVTQIFLLQRT
jgi:hypothetical protein